MTGSQNNGTNQRVTNALLKREIEALSGVVKEGFEESKQDRKELRDRIGDMSLAQTGCLAHQDERWKLNDVEHQHLKDGFRSKKDQTVIDIALGAWATLAAAIAGLGGQG